MTSYADIVGHKLVNQVFRGSVHWIDVAYVSKCLSITLPYHNFVAPLDKLNSVFKFERYFGLVVGLYVLLVKYFNSLHSLPNTSNMKHGLVASLDVRVMVQYLDERVEIFHT